MKWFDSSRWMRWTRAGSVALLGMTASPGIADTDLQVPLQLPYPEVAAAASSALGMDAEGRATLRRNDCNRVRLSDLEVIPEPPHAWVSVAFDAELGTGLFGRCIGPGTARGRLRVLFEPSVADEELAVVLRYLSAELRRPDGSPGLLTRPARMLAERLVLPRLEEISIDVSEPLAGIDAVIGSFAEQAPLLSERSHLDSVVAEAEFLMAIIRLRLAEPPATEAPEAPLTDAELAEWNRIEDELDGFLTAAVLELAEAAKDEALELDLMAILLDARLRIAEALAGDPVLAAVEDDHAGESDPVRELFIDAWNQLRPVVLELQRSAPAEHWDGLRITAFMAGADAIAALDALGPAYNIEISRDGIRRLARMLLEREMPTRFTPLPLGPDPALRELFGAGEPPPAPAAGPSAG